MTWFNRDQKIFIGLTYLLAWSWWIPMAIKKDYVYPGVGWPTHLVALMAPSLAALILVYLRTGTSGLAEIFSRCIQLSSNKLMAVLIIGTAGYAFIPVLLIDDISISDLGNYSGAPASVLGVLIVLFLNGFGEEIGWRGFLADGILKSETLSKAALKVWAVWMPWHLPLFFVVDNYRTMSFGSFIGWAVSIYFGSVVLTWLYLKSSRSILMVVLWHIAYNLSVATGASTPLSSAIISAAVIFGAIAILRSNLDGSLTK